MLKKLLLTTAILLAINLTANETESAEEKCESTYAQCIKSCESNENTDLEQCYTKCDLQYSKCLEDIQSK